MAVSGRDFPALVPLYDLLIHDLTPASGAVVAPVTGSVGASGDNTYLFIMGNNSTNHTLPSDSAALPTGQYGEVIYAEVTSPVVTNGGSTVYPDLQWWLYPDTNDLQSAQFFDGSYGTNMTPRRELTVGRQQAFAFGDPLLRLLVNAKNGNPDPDMPLHATGVKYQSAMQLKVQSTRGWGHNVSGDVIATPARITLWGYRYTDQMLAPYAGFWQPSFGTDEVRRQLEAANGIRQIAGTYPWFPSQATWVQGPGGYQPSATTRIDRYVDFAYNLAASGTTASFFFTNTAPGQSGNVCGSANDTAATTANDLGWNFAPVQGNASAQGAAIILENLGVASDITNIQAVGIQYAGSINVPDPLGIPVSAHNDRVAYGNVQSQRLESELYYAVPALEAEVSVYGENAVPFVTPNGTAIAANTAAIAVIGRKLKLPA